ncbi:MAG: hypothetical protein R2862_09950 [Thermoanaerobaculia bacterium]
MTDVLASVLKSEVDFSALPESTPAAIRRLATLLERRPKNRLHDIADARLAVIDDAIAGVREEDPVAADVDAAVAARGLAADDRPARAGRRCGGLRAGPRRCGGRNERELRAAIAAPPTPSWRSRATPVGVSSRRTVARSSSSRLLADIARSGSGRRD